MTTSFFSAENGHTGSNGNGGPSRLRFEGFELDLDSLELSRDGDPVALQPQPAQVLAALAEHAGQMLSRQELEDLLWPRGTHVDREQGLNYCIRQIRLALDDDSQQPRYVETLPRRGYRFVAPVETPPGTRARAPQADFARRRRWLVWGVAGAALLFAVVGATLGGWLEAPRPEAKAPPTGAGGRQVLAVLPLDDLGGDGVLAAGLTEELSSTLGQLAPQRLAVIAQTAVERHRGLGLGELAEALDADYLLEGSLQQDAHRLHVAVRLIRAADLTQDWAETYDLAAGDAFRVERQVASDVARALALRLPSRDLADLGGTTSPQAFEAFLQGMQLLHLSPPDPEAVTYFRRAVDIDPGFARAWAFLADAYRQRRPFDPADAGRARHAVDRALELRPDLAFAQLEAGLLALYTDFDVAAAQRHMERALALQPSLAAAHNHLAAALAIHGRFDEAQAEIYTALRLDPGSLADQADLGWFAFCARDYETAEEHLRATLAVMPHGSGYIARRHLLATLLARGAWDEAAEMVTTWPEASFAGGPVEPVPGDPRATVEAFLRRDVADLRETYAAGISAPSTFALDYALLGETEQAVQWLRVAAEAGWGWQIPFLRIDPRLDGLRDDPSFQALVEELGLPSPDAA